MVVEWLVEWLPMVGDCLPMVVEWLVKWLPMVANGCGVVSGVVPMVVVVLFVEWLSYSSSGVAANGCGVVSLEF